MKLVYKLGQKYFNIKNLKEVSEIKIVNKYDEQELQKKQDQETNKIFTTWGEVRIYLNYSEDCEEISISIDGVNYNCRNWEVFEGRIPSKSVFSFVNNEYKVTKKQQKEFNKFKKEAKELIKAFKEL